MMEAMVKAIENEETTACTVISGDDWYLDIQTSDDDEKICVVSHDWSNRYSENVEKWVESIVPDWSEAEDEAEWLHTDEDEKSRVLDVAFRSWEEVERMFYVK